MKYFYFLFITLSLILLGCNRTERKIAQIPMEVKVLRIDSIFFHTPAKEFVQIKAKYPLFFPENTTDEEWLEKQADSLQRALFSETERTFGDFSQEKKEIKRIYQHIKYYFPHFKSVKVVTVTSDVDYSSRVIYADSLLVIGLDNYLGAKHPFYVDIDGYIAQEMDKKYLPVDVALAFARAIIPPERNATFLDAMVYEGKILYLAQRFLPSMQEKDILKYTQEKYQWAQENEAQIWRYFIENQLLYSTDRKILSRFIDIAPFSKFYLELDNQSPGGVGRFIGLSIVKQYMEKHPEALQKLGLISTEELFKKANYKPKK
ncbi:gliding motility lipoprotein GldB [Capnocytophaga sp. oral taxon 338]|uniref:gliding motility lipoprotein GldB n=1 Tax=Capnocytophaga sp. oral taxon 338 TaxID=710239 RepID=UPI000202F815|nr:gliding motility lipoprotein GldB [Capnocytophaga sp. oral taxon 338]EGD34793.1 gliding motility protein GldB [Capnocytophaga sp. oral taxon 338 str. F0234]